MSETNVSRYAHLTPDPARKILWATTPLEQQVDALRARNWITEDLIGFSQKHWHCSREEALERLLTQSPEG
ncbi:MAG: hypothetical protein WCI73_03300 [Phycisphaerae bacterium]